MLCCRFKGPNASVFTELDVGITVIRVLVLMIEAIVLKCRDDLKNLGFANSSALERFRRVALFLDNG
jgi:hypothetical protein